MALAPPSSIRPWFSQAQSRAFNYCFLEERRFIFHSFLKCSNISTVDNLYCGYFMAQILLVNSYEALLRKLKHEIQEGMQNAQKAFEKERVLTYWRVGEIINGHILEQGRDSSGYGQRLFRNLSKDLGVGELLLYRVRQFYLKYPKFKPRLNLKWYHYQVLTSVEDKKKRDFFEKKTDEQNLSVRELENLIKSYEINIMPSATPTKPNRLNAYRGKLMTYELFKADYSEELLVDCGFNTFVRSGLKSFPGEFAQVSFKNGKSHFLKSQATRKDRFTYKAYLEGVIDGDTIWVILDVGFSIFLRQKVRFRGIEAEEKTTSRGMKAFHFVQDRLKDLPFLIIKSHSRDKFDRYLVDVYYLKDENSPQVVLGRGTYLNQELLNNNLAEIY